MVSAKPMLAAVRVTLSGLPGRWPMAVSSVVGTALVVAVLLGFLAMAEGFTRALAAAGSHEVAVIVPKGVRSETLGLIAAETAQEAEAVLANAGVDPRRISRELVRVVAIARADRTAGSLVLRGVAPPAPPLRPQRRGLAGSVPTMPGPGESVLGGAAARQLGVAAAGVTVKLEGRSWRVVDIAEAEGSALESEAWVVAESLRAAWPDQPALQSLRAPLGDTITAERLAAAFEARPTIGLRAEREDRFFGQQSAGSARMLRKIAWPLAIVMAIGALAGALNTLFSSVAARTREIATLRAIGFGPGGTFLATFAEALLLSVLGALIGIALAAALFVGRQGSTLAAGGSEVGFVFALTPHALTAGVIFAMVIGMIGGVAPALRAARQPVLAGLNHDSN